MASAVQEELGVALAVRDVMLHPTIEALAERVREGGGDAAQSAELSSLVEFRAGGDRQRVVCVHPAGGTAFCYLPLSAELADDIGVVGLQAPGINPGEPTLPGVEAMAEEYLRLIGPRADEALVLCGLSYGGLIAYEMGRRLVAAGHERVSVVIGIKVAASTVWEILREHGIPPAPERQGTTWSDFPHNQADALLACDFFETRTLTGARLYVFAVIEHASRHIRILGTTAHPTAAWVVQLERNLVMDLEDADARAQFMIRDRDSKFTAAFDAVLQDAGLRVLTCGIRMPRMNSIMERWVQTCRRELLDRTLIQNQRHLLHAPYASSSHSTATTDRTGPWTKPLRPLPEPTTSPGQIRHLDIHRRDRLGGTLHEYQHTT